MNHKVIFLLVKDLKQKLTKLVSIVHYHFSHKEHLLLITSDLKATSYLDNLLWETPQDSFLPHIITDKPCEELIVLTQEKKNLNGAKYIFNLSPTPLFLPKPPKIIYEFEDLTSLPKQLLSKKRFQAYKEAKYPIESA